MLWIDVEQCDGCWSGDLNYNCQFVASIINQWRSMGINVGIYTSPYEWPSTVGGCNLAQYPLWWGKDTKREGNGGGEIFNCCFLLPYLLAQYDGSIDFSNFRPFGGWSAPSIHQFADSADNSCGISIDRNWYPA